MASPGTFCARGVTIEIAASQPGEPAGIFSHLVIRQRREINLLNRYNFSAIRVAIPELAR